MSCRPLSAMVPAALVALVALSSRTAAQTPAPPAAPAPATAPQGPDWAQEVLHACTSPRLGLRLAAGRKVAGGGEPAVAAVHAFQDKNGRNAVPVSLVEAFADTKDTTAPVVGLLTDWAKDREFYWRAQALRGLALRRLADSRVLFVRGLDDPAWLYRTWARMGLYVPGQPLTGGPALDGLADADPRAQARFAALLLGSGEKAGIPILLDALADERTFLGDPWGKRRSGEALQAFKDLLGRDFGFDPAQGVDANHGAVSALLTRLENGHGLVLEPPKPRTDSGRRFVGGIEVLSCRDGDLFLRWTDDGQLWNGLDEAQPLPLRTASWERLSQERTGVRLEPTLGVVICDRMRLQWQQPDLHAVVAPGALPAAATDWLKHLAAAIEEAGDRGLAEQLRLRLQQFAAH